MCSIEAIGFSRGVSLRILVVPSLLSGPTLDSSVPMTVYSCVDSLI